MDQPKLPLLGLTPDELRVVAARNGLPAYAATQIADWLYRKRVATIDEMTNLSLNHRTKLARHYEVGRRDPIHAAHSADGTVKYLFQAAGTASVEAVYIPSHDGDRATLCVSSQVGCKMNCLFCMTGKQGFTAHLTATEILNQILSVPQADTLTNVVLMGMGEPFDNIDEVLRALTLMTDPKGLAWSPRRITVSTVGLARPLRRFLDESDCHLAISLHNPFPHERLNLMPAEKATSLVETLRILRRYDFGHQRRLSFEYIVFRGVNDSERHARELVRLLDGLPCRINLIRFHAIPGVPLQGVDDTAMTAFRDYLTTHGIFTTIRASRGEDIWAACGMLSTIEQQSGAPLTPQPPTPPPA